MVSKQIPINIYSPADLNRAIRYHPYVIALEKERDQLLADLTKEKHNTDMMARNVVSAHMMINKLHENIDNAKSIVMKFCNKPPLPTDYVSFTEVMSYQNKLLETLNGV
jgi:hypothetical protein